MSDLWLARVYFHLSARASLVVFKGNQLANKETLTAYLLGGIGLGIGIYNVIVKPAVSDFINKQMERVIDFEQLEQHIGETALQLLGQTHEH